MLDNRSLEALITSPGVQATVALLLFSFVLQWYFSLPPAPKFPKADLDEKDWHGSLEKAKAKVC
jgi:gliotoxin biosynthesis cytochrome P450 monooxygenase